MQDDSFAEIPDWLKELDEPPSTEELIQDRLGEERAGWLGPPAEPSPASESLVDDLRAQALESELEELERLEKRPRRGLGRVLLGLTPMQRFVLALLFFLDLALLGCMCLVMTGRVVPFQ